MTEEEFVAKFSKKSGTPNLQRAFQALEPGASPKIPNVSFRKYGADIIAQCRDTLPDKLARKDVLEKRIQELGGKIDLDGETEGAAEGDVNGFPKTDEEGEDLRNTQAQVWALFYEYDALVNLIPVYQRCVAHLASTQIFELSYDELVYFGFEAVPTPVDG